MMTVTQQFLTIAAVALATILTRFLPFLVFRSDRSTPKYIQYLGKHLPLSVFALLIVYCLRNVEFTGGTFGVPELIGIAVTIALHLWKRQMILSIAGGTVIYMIGTVKKKVGAFFHLGVSPFGSRL